MKYIYFLLYYSVSFSGFSQLTESDTLPTLVPDSVMVKELSGVCSYVSPCMQVSQIMIPDSLKIKVQDFELEQRNFDYRGFLSLAVKANYRKLVNYIDPANIEACLICNTCTFGCTTTTGHPALNEIPNYKIIFSPSDIATACYSKGFHDLWITKIILLHELEHLFGHDPDHRVVLESFEKKPNSTQNLKKQASKLLQQAELRCDAYAATYAAVLGASLDQVLMAIKVVQCENPSFVYPSLKERIDIMTASYNDGLLFRANPRVSYLISETESISDDIAHYEMTKSSMAKTIPAFTPRLAWVKTVKSTTRKQSSRLATIFKSSSSFLAYNQKALYNPQNNLMSKNLNFTNGQFATYTDGISYIEKIGFRDNRNIINRIETNNPNKERDFLLNQDTLSTVNSIFNRGLKVSSFGLDTGGEEVFEPEFLVIDNNLFYKNSHNRNILIGRITPVTFAKFKFVIRDKYYISWYIDDQNRLHNQNNAIIGYVKGL